MTLILIKPELFTSKSTLKEALDNGCYIQEPSISAGWTRSANEMPVGFRDVITNHPKRSKFAQIEKTTSGWKVS